MSLNKAEIRTLVMLSDAKHPSRCYPKTGSMDFSLRLE